MRLSKFEKWICNWVIFGTLLFVVLRFPFTLINDSMDSRIIGLCVLGVFLLLLSMTFFEDIGDIFVYRYRIIQENGYYFKASVLLVGWFFIPYWKPVMKERHSYESQNIFGAKEKSYYSTEVTFRTYDEAKKVIDEYKEKIIKHRKDFFKRPVKDDKKVTYI